MPRRIKEAGGNGEVVVKGFARLLPHQVKRASAQLYIFQLTSDQILKYRKSTFTDLSMCPAFALKE